MLASGVTNNRLSAFLHVRWCHCFCFVLKKTNCVDLKLTTHDVGISHCRHICSYVLPNSILHLTSDIFMVWLRAMFHSLNARSSKLQPLHCMKSLAIPDVRRTDVTVRRRAALLSCGSAAVVCPSSQHRAIGAFISSLVTSFDTWNTGIHTYTLAQMHICTLAHTRTDSTTVSLEGRKAS